MWCKREHSTTAVEHIVPEAIGCPSGFVLIGGEVCAKCNNKLAYLDREIADTFDILAFESGVPRKGGRPPVVLSRGNFVGKYAPEGRTVFVNMDPQSITTEHGVRLGAYGKSRRNIQASLKHDGHTAQLTYNIEMRFSKTFVRGLHKIALEAVAYFLGISVVLDDNYDPIRRYVVEGSGERKSLGLLSSDTSYHNKVWSPYQFGDHGYTTHIRLAVMEYIVDLTPELSAIASLQASQEWYRFGKILVLPSEQP